MAEAFGANVGGNSHKVKIRGPVAEGVRAAECKDCQCEGVVDGYVASHACKKSGTARRRGLVSTEELH